MIRLFVPKGGPYVRGRHGYGLEGSCLGDGGGGVDRWDFSADEAVQGRTTWAEVAHDMMECPVLWKGLCPCSATAADSACPFTLGVSGARARNAQRFCALFA